MPTKYPFPMQSWFPIVRNWFQSDRGTLIEKDSDSENFVYYRHSASINLTVSAEVTENQVSLNVRGGYSPAGGEKPSDDPQFVNFYQDRVFMTIRPENSRTLIGMMAPSTYHLETQPQTVGITNKEPELSVNANVEANLPSVTNHSLAHASVDFTAHSRQTKMHTTRNDFEIDPPRRENLTYNYFVTQNFCYSRELGYPIIYDINNPDRAMHQYGGCPDSFAKPSRLAEGELWLNTTQHYALDPKRINQVNGQEKIHVDVELGQRQVAMGIWGCCANHWFINAAKFNYSFDLNLTNREQVEITEAKIKDSPQEFLANARYRFFKENPKGYQDFLGPITCVEQRRNDSWRGYNFNPATLDDKAWNPPRIR